MKEDFRVGIGYDIHALSKGIPLMLGGIEIPYAKGLKAHSDGDVLIHSMCDSILGALGEKDIGYHFSDNLPEYKGVYSVKLLEKVKLIMMKKGYRVNNVDVVVIAQEPKLGPHIDNMKDLIAEVLSVSKNTVSIKATTNEGIGDIGLSKAIACHTVVSLVKY